MHPRHAVASLAAVLALACTSTELHPRKPHGAYAVIVPAAALPQAQPLLDAMRARFEKLDVVTTPPDATSRYRAQIALSSISVTDRKSAFAWEVTSGHFLAQKGVVTIDGRRVEGLDRLVYWAGGRRTPPTLESTAHYAPPERRGRW